MSDDFDAQARTHLVVRTSPKGPGQKFVGTCALCGETGLPASAALEPCKNIRGLTTGQSILEAISGEPTPDENDPEVRRYRLREALREVINRHSAENGSDTPDFILADHLMACLEAFNGSVGDRERWYGRHKTPVVIDGPAPNVTTPGKAREGKDG